MTDAASRNIVSRRNRPAKPPLSRDGIVSTALHILDREGLPGLTLRRIAAARGTRRAGHWPGFALRLRGKSRRTARPDARSGTGAGAFVRISQTPLARSAQGAS